MVGCDRSANMAAICAGRGLEVLVCDGLRTPFRTDAFDAVISIAVIHHWCTEERRLDSLRELSRITRPGGQILVYAWAMEQDEKYTEQDNFIPWHLSERFKTQAAAAPKEDQDVSNDASKPSPVVCHRYYHLFRRGELQGLVARIPSVAVVHTDYDKENWVVILRKSSIPEEPAAMEAPPP
eukprot:TRINITY_DN9945_c0_g1_i1.p2 TRINITY_DN9945_c0_g1~~TRINITY_DN9945_c0_g1_i1.p2  ORF type:complete len:181 (-),score=68.43 TRINITY_DN9945_c0_g1_i1:22-564(-)